jgi:hypothetical protein
MRFILIDVFVHFSKLPGPAVVVKELPEVVSVVIVRMFFCMEGGREYNTLMSIDGVIGEEELDFFIDFFWC